MENCLAAPQKVKQPMLAKSHPIQPISSIPRYQIREPKTFTQGFPGGPEVKNPSANAEHTGSIPGPGRSHIPQSN